MTKKSFAVLFVMVLTILSLTLSYVIAQDAENGPKVIYYGEEITFEELESRGIITHCMDDVSRPGSGIVICFDSREERNSEFGKLSGMFTEGDTEQAQSRSGGILFFHRYACYTGGAQYTVSPDQANNTDPADSISRDGQIAVELFRLANYDPSNGTWIVADSHCFLSNGWAGTGIKSAKRLW